MQQLARRAGVEVLNMSHYAYMRVSTETQAIDGNGLEVQRAAIEQAATAAGVAIAAWFEDAGVTGRAEGDTDLSKRRGLLQLLAKVRPGDVVMVYNTSRLWRDDVAAVVIRERLKAAGVVLHSVQQPLFDLYAMDPYTKFQAALYAAVDALERDTIVDKLAKGRAAKAARGDKPAGVAPYGYAYAADGHSIVVDPVEAANVRLMFSRAQAGRTLHQIVEELTANGTTTRRGKPWSRAAVAVILHNRFYVGEVQHNGQTFAGNHDAIISRVQFGKVASKLASRDTSRKNEKTATLEK